MIERITLFLGEVRLRAIFLLLALTGLVSLVLNAIEAGWVVGVQSLLVIFFLVGTGGIVLSALDSFERGRWLGILAPALGAILLALTLLPNLAPLLIGAALGWVIAAAFVFKPRAPMAYQQAVKHMRKAEYAEAVKVMDGMIKDEPERANHYRFRAELMRLWGKLDRARRDYHKMTELEPDSAVGYNGLAEVNLQAGQYDAAHEAALKAYALAPDEWVAAYNLGMIEDRLQDSEAVLIHLHEALTLKVPDARHRLLIQLYILRAHSRLGEHEAAERALEALKKEVRGLREWQKLLAADQAEALRAVLAQDVRSAEALISGEITPQVLVQA